MPTVLHVGPYRFFFYAGDKDEPEHIHVESEGSVAKFWLNPIRLERSGGFGRAEMRRIQHIIEQNHSVLLEAWHDYFQG